VRRRSAHERSAIDEDLSPPSTPEDRAQRRELAESLTRALDQLPSEQRDALVLCEVEERSAKEAARIVGAKEATIRTRVFHAKKKLRALLFVSLTLSLSAAWAAVPSLFSTRTPVIVPVPVQVPVNAPPTPAPTPAPRPAPPPRMPAPSPPPRILPPPKATAAIEDRETPLYREAHEAHFVARDPARALAAWDAYLGAHPNGRFAPEARHNRAITLLRLGRRDEARAALAPFADGAFGDYRKREARRLLDALD
jgi:hypothetical protein